jgi:hypothetical protein
VETLTVEASAGVETFDSGSDRLIIDGSPLRADYRLTVPTFARDLSVWVGGTAVFSIREGEVSTLAVASGPGTYALSFDELR